MKRGDGIYNTSLPWRGKVCLITKEFVIAESYIYPVELLHSAPNFMLSR